MKHMLVASGNLWVIRCAGELLRCAVHATSTYLYICLGSCALCALRFIPYSELLRGYW